MRNLRKHIQCDVLIVVRFDILLQLDAFPAGFDRGFILEGKIGASQQFDHHHFKEILTDQLIVFPFFPPFPLTAHSYRKESLRDPSGS